MNEKINIELAKLQKELSTLENAVGLIDKAGKYSDAVVSSVQELTYKFETSLNSLLENTTKQIAEHSKISSDKLTAALASNTQQANENAKLINEIKSETKDFVKFSTEKISELTKAHDNQISSTNKLLEDYLGLAKSTALLTKTIEQVNFPERLDKITVNIGILNDQLRNIQVDLQDVPKNSKIDQIENKVKRTNRRANLAIVLIVIALIFIVGISFETVFLKYFPNLMDFVK